MWASRENDLRANAAPYRGFPSMPATAFNGFLAEIAAALALPATSPVYVPATPDLQVPPTQPAAPADSWPRPCQVDLGTDKTLTPASPPEAAPSCSCDYADHARLTAENRHLRRVRASLVDSLTQQYRDHNDTVSSLALSRQALQQAADDCHQAQTELDYLRSEFDDVRRRLDRQETLLRMARRLIQADVDCQFVPPSDAYHLLRQLTDLLD